MLYNFINIIVLILNLLAVFLSSKRYVESWLFSILAAMPLVYIFYSQELYGQMIIQIYYLGYSFYGLSSWTKNRLSNTTLVKVKKANELLIWTTILGTFIFSYSIVSLILNYNFKSFLDVYITVLSIIGLYQLSKRYLQNWYCWIISDLLACYLFYDQKMYWILFLYLAMLFIAIYGYFSWKKSLN